MILWQEGRGRVFSCPGWWRRVAFCVGVREGRMGGFSGAARRRGAVLRAGWRSGVAFVAGKEARWVARLEACGRRMQGERFDGISSS